MKLEVYKHTTKRFEDIFEKEKEIKEVRLKIGDTILIIAEHQLGLPLDKPEVDIITPNCTYSIDFDRFIDSFIKGISQ